MNRQRSKRAAVVNSTVNNEEPAQKRREEESVPSPEFVEMREQIRKLKRMLEGAESRDAELRAERAKNLLDSQRGLIEREKLKERVEELEKKLNETNQKLAQYEGEQQTQLSVAVGRPEVARSDDMGDETIDISPNGSINDVMNDTGGPPNEESHSEATGDEVVQLGMKCPGCQFLTTSDETFLHHLTKKHNTNPKLAGIVLKCGCGKEVTSNWHGGKCNVGKFTVVRKRGGPIRRIGDPPVTPKCVLCDEYPDSLNGYASHLRVKHNKSKLATNGVYLKCSCGGVVSTEHFSSHHKQCDGDFTLHKLGEE